MFWSFVVIISFVIIYFVLSIILKHIEKKENKNKPKPVEKKWPFDEYKTLEKRSYIKYDFDPLDPYVKKALNVIFDKGYYDSGSMCIVLGQKAKDIKGLDNWLIKLDVLEKKNVGDEGMKKVGGRRYNLKMKDPEKFASLIGLKK
jgi:hypothetical protein